jgi:hypothetical protein
MNDTKSSDKPANCDKRQQCRDSIVVTSVLFLNRCLSMWLENIAAAAAAAATATAAWWLRTNSSHCCEDRTLKCVKTVNSNISTKTER